jgi:FAD/FMN-containing dehydrogenase
MRRRDVVNCLAAGVLVPGLPVWAVGRGRVRPDDPLWPSRDAWAGLDRAVGGRLINPVPIAQACEDDARSPACAALFQELANPFYVGDQPGGTQVSGWLDAWRPQVSPYAVAAASAADVAQAVNFARRNNLRLAVKGGGHSYQGGSNAPDSLLIWTRRMNAITEHEAFSPRGAPEPAGPAVSIGAGAMWIDAYDQVTTKGGRYVQGGGCTTVGVAGLTLGGGFGSFSKGYGTAAASLLEAEIVTADGAVRVVNSHRHPDLFWALKGGGQSAFGVVTRLTLKTHPLADTAGGAFGSFKDSSNEAFRRLLGRFVDLYAEHLFNPHWGESVHIGSDNSLRINMVFQGLTTAQAHAAWRPLIDWAATDKEISTTGPLVLGAPMRGWWDFSDARRSGADFVKFDPRPGAPAHYAWWKGDGEQVSMFLHGYDSLWLPASLLAPAERSRLADTLYATSRQFGVELHFNKGLAGGASEAVAASRNTATNPAVLDAFALAIIATGGLPAYPGYPKPNLAAAERDKARIDAATAALRPLAPAGGSYVSESNYFNPDWRRSFWGRHYPRLAAIKARYDPTGLFVMRHGVGGEHWSDDGFTRLA